MGKEGKMKGRRGVGKKVYRKDRSVREGKRKRAAEKHRRKGPQCMGIFYIKPSRLLDINNKLISHSIQRSATPPSPLSLSPPSLLPPPSSPLSLSLPAQNRVPATTDAQPKGEVCGGLHEGRGRGGEAEEGSKERRGATEGRKVGKTEVKKRQREENKKRIVWRRRNSRNERMQRERER